MPSRHVGRSVLIGTVTPNRNGRSPPVVLESVVACPFVARTGARLVVQPGAVDEFLGAAVERSASDQLEVEVGRNHEDRISGGRRHKLVSMGTSQSRSSSASSPGCSWGKAWPAPSRTASVPRGYRPTRSAAAAYPTVESWRPATMT